MIAVGDLLDEKYRVAGRLGSGGFGEVFLADDEAIPGRQVALKLLSGRPPGEHGALLHEMRSLAQFNHPGVVGFHHHFMHQGQLMLAMEYCPGGSLDGRLVAGGAVAVDEVFRWGVVLCDTLAFVHGKGIVHHDIKPANILFAQDGSLKVGDFGVANLNAGTRLYLPPEMLLGESVSRTDARVDVYALGITLVEAATGENPFELLKPEEALRARVAHQTVPASLPRWAQEVLLRATHPTPELRFQNMAEFGQAIRARHVPYVLDGQRIKAHALAERAEQKLSKRQWKQAKQLADQALHLSPDCTAALLAAGRCHLLIRRTAQAQQFFSRALDVSPRMHVQKELGWLHLEEGNVPMAISLLCDHLDRNAADFEAYNLLLECFYRTGRFEAGEDLARKMMAQKTPSDCFRNNRFICRLLNGGYTDAALAKIDDSDVVNPFVAYNLAVAREKPSSWSADGQPALRDKLLFQDYRSGLLKELGKQNKVSVRLPDGRLHETDAPVVALGSMAANEVVLNDPSVSRRHAVITNRPSEVWLHNLGSSVGMQVDGNRLEGRVFLDGVHKVHLGRATIEVAARADLLV
ncbi:MAG TPA: protein kinase [Aquabacterium sp.]|nr:protein kinase [Aquabacterium sp.]